MFAIFNRSLNHTTNKYWRLVNKFIKENFYRFFAEWPDRYPGSDLFGKTGKGAICFSTHWLGGLDLSLKPSDISISNMAEKLAGKGDLWRNLYDPKTRKKNNLLIKQILMHWLWMSNFSPNVPFCSIDCFNHILHSRIIGIRVPKTFKQMIVPIHQGIFGSCPTLGNTAFWIRPA